MKLVEGLAAGETLQDKQVVILDDDGSLVGPFAAMLHFPTFGVPALLLQRAVNEGELSAESARSANLCGCPMCRRFNKALPSISASKAHAAMLATQGIISKDDAKKKVSVFNGPPPQIRTFATGSVDSASWL